MTTPDPPPTVTELDQLAARIIGTDYEGRTVTGLKCVPEETEDGASQWFVQVDGTYWVTYRTGETE